MKLLSKGNGLAGIALANIFLSYLILSYLAILVPCYCCQTTVTKIPVPDLKIFGSDFTKWKGSDVVVPVMAIWVTYPFSLVMDMEYLYSKFLLQSTMPDFTLTPCAIYVQLKNSHSWYKVKFVYDILQKHRMKKKFFYNHILNRKYTCNEYFMGWAFMFQYCVVCEKNNVFESGRCVFPVHSPRFLSISPCMFHMGPKCAPLMCTMLTLLCKGVPIKKIFSQ